jgi:hypothetical protein
VKRLRNDLERLVLDVADVDALPPAVPGQSGGSSEMHQLTDEPYDASMWTDADDEGLGGYHGSTR